MVSLKDVNRRPEDFPSRCRAATERALQAGYLARLFPEARRSGKELMAGNIYGGRGKSFGVNLHTGEWHDFADPDHKGGDIVSLIARRENITQGEALEKLEEELGVNDRPPAKPHKKLPAAPVGGQPTKTWVYTDQKGRELYRAQRWEKPGHSKSCRMAGFKEGQERVPLYLTELLAAIKKGEPVYLTEGEPKADLLRSWGLAATSFAGGVNGYRPGMAKWFAGGRVVIVVDCDDPGREFGRKFSADLKKQGNKGTQVIELPAPRFEGYDLIDWQKDGGTAHDFLDLVSAVPATEETGDAADIKYQWSLEGSTMDSFLTRGFKDYEWLIKGSFRRGQLGLICGPPGCGKGIFSIQLLTALATGTNLFDFWEIAEPARVLFVSAEDDREVLQNRIVHTWRCLSDDLVQAYGDRAWAVPIQGRVNLCESDRSGAVHSTQNYEDLKERIAEARPNLLILDTMARMFEVNENDNQAMTAACGLLEDIIKEFGCNIILIHHTGKLSGDLVTDKKALKAALSQTAIRGASALAGAIRWALLMAPLSDDLARKVIGRAAEGKPSGSYVAARVAKKNAGRSEGICYLERGEHGLLSRVYPVDEPEDDAQPLADAHQLAAEVDRREMKGEEALAENAGAREVFGWGHARTKKSVECAVENGLLIKTRQKGRRGFVLAIPPQEAHSDDE